MNPIQVSGQHLPMLVGGFILLLIFFLGVAHWLNRAAAR